MASNPRVSVVLVNYRGATDTLEAIESLSSLAQYPDDLSNRLWWITPRAMTACRRFEKAPHTPSLSLNHPQILALPAAATWVLPAPRETSWRFSTTMLSPMNTGSALQWKALTTYRSGRALASNVVSWDGTRIDYQGSGLTWYGMGYRPHTGDKMSSKNTQESHPVLFWHRRCHVCAP